MTAKLYLAEYEKQALDSLILALRKLWHDAKFIVFGSKTTGTFDPESDIDLLILLPCEATADLRSQIIREVFNINLFFGSNISVLIVSENEWQRGRISVLPIHDVIKEEGIPI